MINFTIDHAEIQLLQAFKYILVYQYITVRIKLVGNAHQCKKTLGLSCDSV